MISVMKTSGSPLPPSHAISSDKFYSLCIDSTTSQNKIVAINGVNDAEGEL